MNPYIFCFKIFAGKDININIKLENDIKLENAKGDGKNYYKISVEDRIQGDHRKGSRFVILLPVMED
jgi:hypothetical protein